MKAQTPQLALSLFHGRTNPEEDLEGWGTDGPTLGPFFSFYVTYNSTFRILVEADNDPIELTMVDGMLYYNGVYYGDWVISTVEVFKAEGKNIEAFVEQKTVTKKEFDKQVDSLMKRDYGLNFEDIDEVKIKDAFEGGETPEEFVNWYAEKYDFVKNERY